MSALGAAWAWLVSPAFTVWGQTSTWLEVAGFVTGALCVWLVAREHIANWGIGIANNVAFGALFLTAGLFADAALQVVYLALAVWGWWAWVHAGPSRTDRLPVTASSTVEWLWLAVATGLGTLVLTWVLATWSTSTVPLADGVTTAISLAATYGQIRKRVGSWWLWITADLIYIPLYAYKDLWLTAVLYVVFLALCVQGLRTWRAQLAVDAAPINVPGERTSATPETVPV